MTHYPAPGQAAGPQFLGGARHFEVAETAEGAVITAANSPSYLVSGARAGRGFLAVQRRDPAAAANHYASLASSRGTAMVGFSLVFDRLLGLLSQAMAELDLAAEHFEA